MDKDRFRVVWLFGSHRAGASVECLDCTDYMALADDLEQAWRLATRHEREEH